jgi:hypothetical protein
MAVTASVVQTDFGGVKRHKNRKHVNNFLFSAVAGLSGSKCLTMRYSLVPVYGKIKIYFL